MEIQYSTFDDFIKLNSFYFKEALIWHNNTLYRLIHLPLTIWDLSIYPHIDLPGILNLRDKFISATLTSSENDTPVFFFVSDTQYVSLYAEVLESEEIPNDSE